jgi:hypothetical protein
MRKFLIILLLLIVGVGALGLYRGWFTFSTVPDKEDGRPGVELRINENKIKSDAEQAKDKVTGSPSSFKEGLRDK